MNRRLVIRCAVSCLALCLVAWRLPPMIDKTFASIDEHKGTISLLTGEGVTMPVTTTGATHTHHPEAGVEVFAANGATLTPEQRARLLDAARRHDPLAQLKAAERATTPSKPAPTNAPEPAKQPEEPKATSFEDALRELGLDPALFDPKTLDVEAMLKKAREGASKRQPKR